MTEQPAPQDQPPHDPDNDSFPADGGTAARSGQYVHDDDGNLCLAMPLVAAQSEGGPFEDTAFVAGWQIGGIDTTLKVGAAIGMTQSTPILVDKLLAKQLDLVALKHGYQVQTNQHARNPECGDMWVRFVVAGNADDESA
jgi:hypothetical protein